MLFGTTRDGLEADSLPTGVDSVARWSELLVAANESDVHAKWSHVCHLGTLVEVSSNLLSDHVNGSLIAELHFELSGFLSHVSHKGSGVVQVSDDDSSAVV